jgi:hypothetical protein
MEACHACRVLTGSSPDALFCGERNQQDILKSVMRDKFNVTTIEGQQQQHLILNNHAMSNAYVSSPQYKQQVNSPIKQEIAQPDQIPSIHIGTPIVLHIHNPKAKLIQPHLLPSNLDKILYFGVHRMPCNRCEFRVRIPSFF